MKRLAKRMTELEIERELRTWQDESTRGTVTIAEHSLPWRAISRSSRDVGSSNTGIERCGAGVQDSRSLGRGRIEAKIARRTGMRVSTRL